MSVKTTTQIIPPAFKNSNIVINKAPIYPIRNLSIQIKHKSEEPSNLTFPSYSLEVKPCQ